MPNCPNLNFYRGNGAQVLLHCDGEALFGNSRAKNSLFLGGKVGLLFFGGSQSPVLTRRLTRLLARGSLDGGWVCSDGMPHCTDPGLEEERTNITYSWQSCVAATQPTCETFGTSGPLWRKVIGGCVFLLLVGTGRMSYNVGQGRNPHAGQIFGRIIIVTTTQLSIGTENTQFITQRTTQQNFPVSTNEENEYFTSQSPKTNSNSFDELEATGGRVLRQPPSPTRQQQTTISNIKPSEQVLNTLACTDWAIIHAMSNICRGILWSTCITRAPTTGIRPSLHREFHCSGSCVR